MNGWSTDGDQPEFQKDGGNLAERGEQPGSDYPNLVRKDGRDVHLSTIDRGADADLAELRAENVVAMFG
jgi:hypothetical protein